MPTEFPINHDDPLDFEPFPTTPPIPESPTDGLRRPASAPEEAKKTTKKKKTTAKKKGS